MFVLYFLLFVYGASAQIISDENHFRMPPLFHLDDYERCLSQKDGLYCLGVIQLTPEKGPHDAYTLMKEYSNSPYSFNRTLIHRGYCVSARCPSAERNSSLRFEHCTTQWGRERALRTTLHTLYYCREHKDTQIVKPPSTSQHIYKWTIYLILFLNMIGTLYDYHSQDDLKNNNLLKLWSLRSSWQRLTATYEDGDPQLAPLTPLHGARIMAFIIIITAHSCLGFIHHVYLKNPQTVERWMRTNPVFKSSSNATAGIQALLVMSTSLTSYNILLLTQKYSIGLNVLPAYIMKRVSRISPVYIVVVGYMATWWPSHGDGPLWPILVTAHSEICRQKFWWQFFYVNNVVDMYNHCLPPAWFLAADMHLGILAVFLTLMAIKLRRRALPILTALYLASSLFIIVLSYVKKWKYFTDMITTENLRTLFKNEPAFVDLYISSWSALPACFLGVFMGYMQFENVQHGFKISEHKWFMRFYKISLPLLLAWSIMGYYLKEYRTTLVTTLYLSIERPMFSITAAVLFYGVCNIDGPSRRFFAWKGFYALSRMSLSVMLVNWLVIFTISAGRLTLITVTFVDLFMFTVGVVFITYMLSFLLTILVEIPMRRFLGELMLRQLMPK